MELKKQPGKDGLPTEFYNTFWNELKYILTQVTAYIYTNHNQCSRTQKRAIISLQYIEGEREILNNWRSISLLCTDYKLTTKNTGKQTNTDLTPHLT